MTNTNARRKANDLVMAALTAAGAKDGITLTPEQIKSTTDATFWRNGVPNPAICKTSYIVYSIAGTDAAIRGDDKTILREGTIAIDVFSKASFESKSNAHLLKNLEAALVIAGFEVEFEAERYEDDTTLYHLPITAFKIL